VSGLLACAVLWSLSGALIKLLNAEGVPPLSVACLRSMIGGLVFLPLAVRSRSALTLVPTHWLAASIGTFTLMTVTFVVATAATAAANAIILQYTSPMWVFLLAPLLLGEKPRLADGVVLAVAMVGVAVLFLGNASTHWAGMAVALVSGFGYGSLTVVLRRLRPVHPTVVTCLNCAGSGLILLPPMLLWGRFRPDGADIALLLVLSLFQFSVPYMLFSWSLQRVEAHRAALIVLLETVLNPIWTYVVVGEAVPGATLVGGPLILAGVVGWVALAWWQETRGRRAAPVVSRGSPP
jgi:drug/metabolite transporter (DMT)-like permease